ncbi:MAG: endoglucanase, partial [Selenomonas sp.]|nr:endoglucanase [Selenomonas sp.]
MQSTRKLRCLVLAGLMALGTYGLSTTALAADAGLHVDQVGYLTNHTKVAMVSAASGDRFKLVDVKTGKTVY